jgi:hypothetical protein
MTRWASLASKAGWSCSETAWWKAESIGNLLDQNKNNYKFSADKLSGSGYGILSCWASPPPLPPTPANQYICDCFEDASKALTQNINNGANIDMGQEQGWGGEEDCANKAKYYASQEF